MKRPLRIAVSGFFVAVVIALSGLWARSNRMTDYLIFSIGDRTYAVKCQKGGLTFGTAKRLGEIDGWYSYPLNSPRDGKMPPLLGRWSRPNIVRYWHLFSLSLVIAFMPWYEFRYSLRSLLIITVLVALFLASFL